MPEKDIRVENFFRLSDGKDSSLCVVKFCRKRRKPDRKLCAKCTMRLWRARNPMRAAFESLKAKARQRKITFTLLFSEFMEIAEATGYIENRGRSTTDLHMDRENPDEGYTLKNLRVITCSENSRKGSYERWITLKSGKRVRLCDIGIGKAVEPVDVPEPEEEEPEWLKSDDPF